MCIYTLETAGCDEPQRGEGGCHLLHPPSRGVHRHASGKASLSSLHPPKVIVYFRHFCFFLPVHCSSTVHLLDNAYIKAWC
jgi:hypothetical protein